VKRALVLLAMGLLPLVDRSAHADTPAPPPIVAKASPPFHALPEGWIGDLKIPAVPDRLPAKERAEGFAAGYPTMPAAREKRRPSVPAPEPTMVLVSSSTAAIKRMFSSTRDEGDARDEAPVPACFMISAGTREAEGNMASWTGGFTTIANLPVWSAESTYFSRVRLVRKERLIRDDAGHASLEIAHAWVDTASLGMRLIDRRHVTLAEVQAGPSGLVVYAAREGKRVLFVLRPPNASPDNGFPLPLMFTGEGGSSGSSQCGSLAIQLRAERVGDAQMSTVTGELAVPVDPDATASTGREFQTRSFRLTLSTSWLSRDPEPVLGTSFGWFGKPRTDLR